MSPQAIWSTELALSPVTVLWKHLPSSRAAATAVQEQPAVRGTLAKEVRSSKFDVFSSNHRVPSWSSSTTRMLFWFVSNLVYT